jgi:hypothetical protein
MAVIRSRRQVGPGALPGARLQSGQTPDSLGAGLEQQRAQSQQQIAGVFARGAQLAAGVVDDIVKTERENANETALLKASNELARWKTTTLYDPENGALTKKGEAALPIPEQVADSFNKTADQLRLGLGNEEQRRAFDRMRAREFEQVDLETRRHVFGEMQEFRASELKSAIDLGVDDATRAANDPRLVGAALNKLEGQLRTNLPKLGVGKDGIEEQVNAVRSKVHTGVISQLLATDQVGKARAYFEESKGEIAAEQLDDVEKALHAGGVKQQAQIETGKILADGGTLSEQRARAKEIADPDVQDEVLQRIEHEAAVKDKIDRDNHEALLKRAYDVLDTGRGVSAIPTADWAQMDPGDRASAWSYARARAEGIPIKTNQAAWYGLMTQAGDDPEAFAKVNLLTYKSKLSDSDFQQLAGIQTSIKNGKRTGADIEDLAGFQTKREIVDNTLAAYGIETRPSEQSKDEQAAVGALMRMLDRRIDIAQAPDQRGKARKVSNTETQQILDELLGQTVDVPGSWWNIWPGGKPFFATKRKLIETTIDDVPATTRREIERALRDAKRPITDATVLDTYREMQVK